MNPSLPAEIWRITDMPDLDGPRLVATIEGIDWRA
jgi:hypothetical protein